MQQRPTEKDAERAVQRLAGSVDEARFSGFGRAAALRRMRAAALSREHDLLVESGAGKEELAAAGGRLRATLAQSEDTRAQLRAAERGRSLRPGDAVVMGRVLDARGRPAAGIAVLLAAGAGREERVLDRATTDEAGVYLFHPTADDFRAFFANAEELLVVVVDRRTGARHTERRPLEAAGRPVHAVDVRLPSVAVPLRDIEGIGPARSARLEEHGILDARALAATAPSRVARILGISEELAAQLVDHARGHAGEG